MANSKTAGKKAPSIPAREAVIAAAGALPAKDIQRPPPYAAAWLAWADNLARLAAKDAGALLLVPLSEGALTVGELERFAAGVALAQEYVMIAGVLRISAAGTETDAERSLLWAVRADQRRLDRALLLRFADDSAGRAFLTGLRRGDPTDPVDALDDTEKLLALADSDAHREWLASLPKGEAAAVATLRAMQPEWSRRVTAREVAPTEAEAPTPRAMAQRAWSLALVEMERVLRAGRYLAKGDAAQEKLWRAYRPAKKAKAPVPAPTPDA